MVRLKNKVGANSTFIEFSNGERNWHNGKYHTEYLRYEGTNRRELEEFNNRVENEFGWSPTSIVDEKEDGSRYLEFERPLQADEVERIYQFYTEEAIQGIPVWVGFVHDTKQGTEEQKQQLDCCHKFGYHGTNMTVNEVQKQFNPEWLGYAMIGAKKEYHGQLAEILGHEPQPYNVVDTDRVPVVMNNPLTFRVDVERLPELITGTIVTMVEYDKTKIGTKESFEDFPISEKTYYFDLNNVDMEAYEALKDYIRIELEEE